MRTFSYADSLYDTRQYRMQIQWWEIALELADCADQDTKTQLKNITTAALDCLQRCDAPQE